MPSSSAWSAIASSISRRHPVWRDLVHTSVITRTLICRGDHLAPPSPIPSSDVALGGPSGSEISHRARNSGRTSLLRQPSFDSQQFAQASDGPGQATVDAQRANRARFKSCPAPKCLRPAAQVKRCAVGIDGDAGLTVEGHEDGAICALLRFRPQMPCGFHESPSFGVSPC